MASFGFLPLDQQKNLPTSLPSHTTVAESSLSTRGPENLSILKINSVCECESVALIRGQEAEKRRNWRGRVTVSSTESGVVGIQMAGKEPIVENRPTTGRSLRHHHGRLNRPFTNPNPGFLVEIELPNVFQTKTSASRYFRTIVFPIPLELIGHHPNLGGSSLPSSTYSRTHPFTRPVRRRIEIRLGIVIRPNAMSPNAQTNSRE